MKWLRDLWLRWQIWFGSRSECCQAPVIDGFDETKWPVLLCSKCKTVVGKY